MPIPAKPSLAEAIERHVPTDGIHATAYPSLELLRAASTCAPTPIVQTPALCLIAQGRKRILLGDRTLAYDADHYLLAALDLPLAGEILEATPGRPYLALRLDIDPVMVAELAVDSSVSSPPGLSLSVNPLDASLLDSLARLIALLDEPKHLPALAPLVHREIVYRLLVGPQGGRLRAIALGTGASGLVAHAVEMLRRDYAHPLRIKDLARELGVSESGLHHHFKTLTAMSPLQFQKRLRLQEARRLMLGQGEDAAGAAFRVGYESPSQFSREYRRHFGAPPGQDATAFRRSESVHPDGWRESEAEIVAA